MKVCTFLAPYWFLSTFVNKDSGEDELHECPVQTDAIGKCPETREEGLDWRPNAQFRALCSGQDLGFHVAVLQM